MIRDRVLMFIGTKDKYFFVLYVIRRQHVTPLSVTDSFFYINPQNKVFTFICDETNPDLLSFKPDRSTMGS